MTILGASWGGVAYGFNLGSTEETIQFYPDRVKLDYTDIKAYVATAIIVTIPLLVARGLHWLIDLLYGKKIRKLKRIVEDLGED